MNLVSDSPVPNRPVYVAPTNTRYGKVPNVSLVPVKDCGNSSYCSAKCYGVRNYRMYEATRSAWSANSYYFRSNPIDACSQVEDWLGRRRSKPTMFRVHVAGDFLHQDHLDAWSGLCSRFPGTKFLAYTKMLQLDFSQRPPNFEVIASQWPGAPLLAIKGVERNAWLGCDLRKPASAFQCQYDIDKTTCDKCRFCWFGKGDVYLRLF
jgi:hypothetical protein